MSYVVPYHSGRRDQVVCYYCPATAVIWVPTGAQFRLPEGCSVSVNGKDRYVCPACVARRANGAAPKGAA